MRYLLDTHVLLWWLDNNSPLSPSARKTIDDPQHDILVSAASLWEIAIKKSIGGLSAPDNILDILKQSRIEILPIDGQHALMTETLPLLHKDPFDRMLIVQATAEDAVLMTHDKLIQTYPVNCLMV